MNDTNKYSPVTHGMRLGVKVSLILASVYAVVGVFVEVGNKGNNQCQVQTPACRRLLEEAILRRLPKGLDPG